MYKNKKVLVRVMGGLGNQLFCYAAARRLSIVNNAELVIDDESGFVRDYTYKRQYSLDNFNISARKATSSERLMPFDRYRRWCKKKYSSMKPFSRKSYIEQKQLDYDSRLIDYKVLGAVYLDGLWQSENYFIDVENAIRKDLAICPPQDTSNTRIVERIRNCNSICIHIRCFDAQSSGLSVDSQNISIDYYHKALNILSSKVDHPHYFVFSDKPDIARQRLKIPVDEVTFVNVNSPEDNAYADLWLMSQCKHFIIANSTFSWWGAWLSNSKDKIVISPDFIKRGVGAWGFDGLIPKTWLLVK